MCPQHDAPLRLAPEPTAPAPVEKEKEQAKEKERRLDAGNRHLDHCACARASHSHIQDRLLSAEQMLDACPNGAMPCATA